MRSSLSAKPTFQPKPPPLFAFPREIRNRIYFWVIAGKLTLRNPSSYTQPGLLTRQECICFSPRGPSPRGPGPPGFDREKIAARALRHPDLYALLATSQVVMRECLDELVLCSTRAARAGPPCKDLNIFGMGAPRSLTSFGMYLVEFFIRSFMSDDSHVVVYCVESPKNDTCRTEMCRTVIDHFEGHGAVKVRRNEKKESPGGLRMQVRGISLGDSNFIGQTTILSGTLDDFLRPELRLYRPAQ